MFCVSLPYMKVICAAALFLFKTSGYELDVMERGPAWVLFLPKAFYPLDVRLVAVTVQKRDGGGLPLIFLHRVLFCSMREEQSCKIVFFKRAATLDMTKQGSQTPSILFTSTTFIMAPGKKSIALRKKCFCTTLGFPFEKNICTIAFP